MHNLEQINLKRNKNKLQSHSILVEESTAITTSKETEMTDICNRIQSLTIPTKGIDNLNYERENSITPKNEIKILKCITQKSQASSVLNRKQSNLPSTKTHSFNNNKNFIDNISVDNYIDFNLKSVHSIFKVKKTAVYSNQYKQRENNVVFNLSNQNMLNNSQQSTQDNIIDVKTENECPNKNVKQKESKECCTLKVFIYIFLFFVILSFLLLFTGLALHFIYSS